MATTPGCLIVNDMAAGADPAAANRYRSLMEDGLRHALSQTAGPDLESDPDVVAQRTAFIAASVLGINLVSKSPATLMRLVDTSTPSSRKCAAGDNTMPVASVVSSTSP